MNNENVINNKGIPCYYANIASMEMSVFDFKINFGVVSQNQEGQNEEIAFNNQIIMSPQHAKALLVTLKRNIEEYERVFGNINIDPKKGE